MKKLNTLLLVGLVMALSSCSIIGGILKVGFAGGVIAVVIVILILIWIISMFKGKN